MTKRVMCADIWTVLWRWIICWASTTLATSVRVHSPSPSSYCTVLSVYHFMFVFHSIYCCCLLLCIGLVLRN